MDLAGLSTESVKLHSSYLIYRMKKFTRSLCLIAVLFAGSATLSSFYKNNTDYPPYRFPYQKAGLTEREAAAHLLSRFSFGATLGQVDAVVKKGLEKWFSEQLAANLADDSVDTKLAGYESLKMTNAQIVDTYPRGGQILKRAIKEGIIDTTGNTNKKDYRDEVKNYMQKNGYKPEAELFRQLINQKILRAAYSNNQLKEVLTDFWFNHFNVSLTKGEDRQFITTYERDAIRPNVLGKFENILLATAKSPAMLTYLDNFQSSANADSTSLMEEKLKKRGNKQNGDAMLQNLNKNAKIKKPKAQGLNENYAREIMELHTLGVDGGYTQSDVTQAARVLTGWTIFPMGEYGKGQGAKLMERMGEDRMSKIGFVHDGDFLFASNRHDGGEKKVLGQTFPSGGGYEEGLKLIHLLATHTSTAKFISRKLAVRFVSDNPPQSLVDKMAKTFLEKDGDIKEVLITMTSAPEFWSREALREKTKSPFELAMSAVRSLDARIDAPFMLYTWITKMGQQMYYYQAPTGFPDKGQYWINTGSLLNRMNFGLALASERIPGIHINLVALNQNHEPESSDAALMAYSKILLPERNVDETVKRLKPMLNDPELVKKVDEAAGQTATGRTTMMDAGEDEMMMDKPNNKKAKQQEGKIGKKGLKNGDVLQTQSLAGNNSMLGQVVGIIIGSPEFQRK
jgi:uncharacterized protein (DUF1800 family)